MNLLDNLGISYKAGYLIQGNQIERCNVSTKLNVLKTELMLRTDGKDSNIDNILKNYKGEVVFHLPAINPDLSNLDVVNNVVKELKKRNVKLITIDASNLSLGLFEWSTMEEQKKFFLNMVTAIATIASNKVRIAIQNLKHDDAEAKFGSTIGQITDLLVYSKKLLVKDFGIKEDEVDNYIGISLNIDNINLVDEKESILSYLEVFNDHIDCIKVHNTTYLNEIIDYVQEKNIPLFMQTKSDLDEIENEYNNFKDVIISNLNDKGITVEIKKAVKKTVKNNKGYSNIIIYTMIVLTIIIIVLMFMIKLQ